MPSVCFYFQVHQPYRLRRYTFFDMGQNHFYEDNDSNREILRKVAQKCYLPMNQLLMEQIEESKGRFKAAFSLTGTVLDQLEAWAPEVIESFQALAATGCVEFLSETDAHSLAFLYSAEEFRGQVAQHDARIEELFGQKPQVFRNTELIYSNDLAKCAEDMGYKAVLAEGADHILGWRSPNYVYQPASCSKIKLLLKNYRLSDDIAFRFSNKQWPEFPLTAEKFAAWVHEAGMAAGDVLNLFMDYETFGEHHGESTGIFQFMKALPDCVLNHPDFDFRTPSEVADSYAPVASLDIPHYVSWADAARDLSAWVGNDLQNDAIEAAYRLEPRVKALHNADMLRTWRRLQTSDHFYYMCIRSDDAVHKYFNPYGSPYNAYINYMNVLGDFELTLQKMEEEGGKPGWQPAPGSLA
ncbi:MAG: glycoside hydrolase family 57 protein [Desulfovibrionaceae bacterium]|nr:glycoside hydrolase family 57 protein [Desulfovibrionaceae bacterium]